MPRAQQVLAVSGDHNGECSLRDFGFIIRKALILQTAHVAQYLKKKKNQKIGRKPKQIFLQRKHTDGQYAHEKTLNITNYWRNADQNYHEVPPHTCQNGYH